MVPCPYKGLGAYADLAVGSFLVVVVVVVDWDESPVGIAIGTEAPWFLVQAVHESWKIWIHCRDLECRQENRNTVNGDLEP